MNNELIERALKHLEHLREDIIIRSQMQDDYVEGEVFVGFSAWEGLKSTIADLEQCKAALTKQQEAEPVFIVDHVGAWYNDNSPTCTIVGTARHKSLIKGDMLYLRPPKPAAQPQVPEDVEKLLRKAFELGKQWWIQADSESYKQNKLADQTMTKFEDLISAAKEEGK